MYDEYSRIISKLHEEGLSALRKRLETRKEKYNGVLTDTIIDLAEVVLKNNIFTFGKKAL